MTTIMADHHTSGKGDPSQSVVVGTDESASESVPDLPTLSVLHPRRSSQMATRVVLISLLLMFGIMMGFMSSASGDTGKTSSFLLRRLELGGGMTKAIDQETTNDGQPGQQLPANQRRQLQGLVAGVLNSLISMVTPTLSNKVQEVVIEYYNVYDFWGYWPYQSLGQVPLSLVVDVVPDTIAPGTQVMTEPNTTTTNTNITTIVSVQREVTSDTTITSRCIQSMPAQLDWKVAGVMDMGGIQVESIAIVPESQKVELQSESLMQVGASWSGEWLMVTTFPQLTAMTTSQLTLLSPEDAAAAAAAGITTTINDGAFTDTDLTACRGNENFAMSPDEESTMLVNGTIVFSNVRLETRVSMQGDTERVLLFPTTSTIQKGTVLSLAFNYDSMDDSQLGTFASGGPPIDNNFIIYDSISTNHPGIEMMSDVHIQSAVGGTIQSQIKTYMEQLLTDAIQEEVDWVFPRPFVYEPE